MQAVKQKLLDEPELKPRGPITEPSTPRPMAKLLQERFGVVASPAKKKLI